VPQIGARVERGAELGEGPALGQPDLGLRDVAARQHIEQRERRHGPGELVAAGLDVALAAERAREHLELEPAYAHPRVLELLGDGAEARAGRDLEVERQARGLERRCDVPGGVARGGR